MLGLWLAAFNSGDRATIDSFDKAHVPWLTIDRAMNLRAQTGGYDLVGVEKSAERWIIFRAKQRATSKETNGKLIVTSSNPTVVAELWLRAGQPGEVPIALDADERERVTENAARVVSEVYVLPEVAKEMSAALKRQQKRGEYRAVTDGDVFAYALSDDLFAVSHDKHIVVRFSPEVVGPDPKPTNHPITDPGARRELANGNCGFERAEHLAPNIGYLKLNRFAEPDFCAPTAIAAMNFLADSDALIIDLRDNHGGSPSMVAFICSYLFDVPTHLDDLVNREENTTEQSWTLSYVPGKTFTGKPVYVLVAKSTFSAAEEFSYDLKNLKRATLVGEATGGGAHLVSPHRLDDHFFMEVPFGRFVNPVTGTDWEGTGVEPDVKVPAAEALSEALKRARGQ